jgi:hypothetical protein
MRLVNRLNFFIDTIKNNFCKAIHFELYTEIINFNFSIFDTYFLSFIHVFFSFIFSYRFRIDYAIAYSFFEKKNG